MWKERNKEWVKFMQPSTIKMECYMHKMLYINVMVTTNQKPVIDMEKIKRKESKYITKESQQTMREESRRRKEHRRTTKTIIKQVIKYLSIF